MDGLQVMRRLREWSQIPIIVVSVRSAEVDKVAAFDAGADDFLTKPFGTGELLARLRAALRHVTQPASLSRFNSGGLNVDLVRHIVAVDGHEIRLTLTEYGLLYVLITHAGKVITPRQLLGEVWGSAYEQNMHMLRVNMSNLRHKIETEPARPRYILTVPGVGYRLSEDQ